MKNRANSTCRILIATVIAALIISAVSLTALAFETTSDGWTFSQEQVANPIYIKKYFDTLPRTYEVELNMPAGTYSKPSPIISNYPANTSRDTFGIEITAAGYPAIYYYSTSYENNTLSVNKIHVPFTDAEGEDKCNVIGKGWVRLALVNETASGSSVYKLYINGELVKTVTDKPDIQDFDAVHSQSTTREMSIGADGSNYFKGTLRSVGVYSSALSAEDILASSQNGTNLSHTSLMAYYDSTKSGNTATSIKDQSGKGHDATPAFFERTSEPSDYAYSFAFVGDTQFLLYQDAVNGKSYASSIYDWIIANKDTRKIQHVFGLGDITDKDNDAEWQYAVAQHERLGSADIPYAIIPGNHDDYVNHVKYNTYFGPVTSFTDNIDGYYQAGRLENFYMNFEVGEHKYMVIGMQYGAPDAVLEWANGVVSANPDRRVIVITHNLLGYEGQWGEQGMREQSTTTYDTLNNGIDFWNDFISLHENIIIAAAGHVDPEHIKHRTDVGVNGNTVNTFLIDPQGLDKATAFETGMVAMFYFSEDGSDVQVEYISAYKTLEAQKADPSAKDVLFHEENQFDFKVDLSAFADSSEKYGTVPDEYASTAAYPIVVFKQDKTFVGGYSSFGAAVEAAGLIGVTNSESDYVILFRDNYTHTANTGYISDFYHNVTVDLGGHTVTIKTSRGFLYLRSGTALKDTDKGETFGNITVKNGSFEFNGSGTASAVARLEGSVGVYPFFAKDIKISSVSSDPYIAVNTGNPSANTINATFTDCIFDYTRVTGNKCYMFASGNTATNKGLINATVVGCEILANSNAFTFKSSSNSNPFALAYYTDYTGVASDTLTLGAGNTLKLVKGTAAPTAKMGLVEFVKTGSDETHDIYEIAVPTAYGNIHPAYESVTSYPIAVFKTDRTFVGGYSSFGEAVKAAGLVDELYSSVGGSDCVILFRANYTHSTETEALQNFYHNVTVDLGGNTVTVTAPQGFFYLWGKTLQDTSKGEAFGKITVKNGSFYFNVSNTGCSVARLAGTVGIYSFHAENIRIISTITPYVGVSTMGGSANTVNATFTNCVFDYSQVTGSKCYMFASGNTASNKGLINATVIGCEILAKSNAFTFKSSSNSNPYALAYYTDYTGVVSDTLTLGAGNTLKLVKGTATPTAKMGLVEFVKTGSDETHDIYEIAVPTRYGNITPPYESVSSYPIVVFKTDRTFVGGYNSWDNALKAAGLNGGAGSAVDGSDCVILFRASYTQGARPAYIFDFYHSVTVDLDNNTVTLNNDRGFLYLYCKTASLASTEFGKLTVKNGSFDFATGSTSTSVARLEGTAGIYSLYAENIRITSKTAPYVGVSTAGGSTNTVNATFTDCIYDYTALDAGKNCYMFASGNDGNIHATVRGGTIMAGERNTFAMTYYISPLDDTIVYEKNDAGEYVTLVMTSGTAAHTATYPTASGDASFVKTGTSGTNDTYTLVLNAIKDFKPKSSITLDANLIFNIYIPENAYLTEITLDGTTYKLADLEALDGKYHLTVELPSAEAARNIPLTVTFGDEASASYTLSILKYASKLLADEGATATEKTLVCDMLAYVKSAYTYFGTAGASEIASAIDAIIGTGASSFEKISDTNGSMAVGAGVNGVTFILDAEPRVRFYFAQGTDLTNYAFKIDGVAQKFTATSETIGETNFVCADISLFAYKMIGTVEVYNGSTKLGSFHINDYYDFALTQNSPTLVEVVERFYMYCKSAKAYRDEVIGDRSSQ